MSAIVTEILNILFSGFSTTATSMGGAITSMVGALFIDSSGTTPVLSTFGSIVVIFAAVSLSLALFRWALNFVTSFGNRNR